MRFTHRGIQKLRPRAERYIIWKQNGDGLGIRVSSAGRKTFIFMYRFNGRPRMMTLGVYGQGPSRLSLADAHEKHAQARKLLERGIDPGEKAVEANQAAQRAATVADLVVAYLEKHAKPKKRSWREDERILNKDVVPRWGRRKARDITRRDVIALLDDIVDRGAPIQANHTFAVIRRMFRFGVAKDLIPDTPCVGIEAPAKSHQRDRVLSEEEIRTFWSHLDEARVTKETRLALKLMLITAQRKSELLSAEWVHFDLEGRWWTIPAENAKNGLPHRVPLSNEAMAILEELRPNSGGSRWLFPSRADQPLTGSGLANAIRTVFRNKIDNFTPHDLRRTAASCMTSGGISRLVVGKVLNHAERGVTAVYDRHSYDPEKRQALEAWDRKLEAILTKTPSSNVLELHQA